jgi:hypothetical protein
MEYPRTALSLSSGAQTRAVIPAPKNRRIHVLKGKARDEGDRHMSQRKFGEESVLTRAGRVAAIATSSRP